MSEAIGLPELGKKQKRRSASTDIRRFHLIGSTRNPTVANGIERTSMPEDIRLSVGLRNVLFRSLQAFPENTLAYPAAAHRDKWLTALRHAGASKPGRSAQYAVIERPRSE